MSKATAAGPLVEQVRLKDWLPWFSSQWEQGQHLALIGPTGAGKTSIMLPILQARDYVAALAIKREDDTLALYERAGYTIVSSESEIMPSLDLLEEEEQRVVIWVKPRSLTNLKSQAEEVGRVLEHLYRAGGWCIFLDDTGYIASQLQLAKMIGVLLGQGRSSHLSIASALVQPSSFVQRVPSETFKQIRHLLIFRFSNINDVKACALIAGIPWRDMQGYMLLLGEHDFLFFYGGRAMIVRAAIAS